MQYQKQFPLIFWLPNIILAKDDDDDEDSDDEDESSEEEDKSKSKVKLKNFILLNSFHSFK